MIARREQLAGLPARIGSQLLAQLPGVQRVERVGVLESQPLHRLADRLEEAFAMLLDQRLEERHAEHLAFALVDARGEEVIDVVAEEMALEEGAAAVRLHEQLDGRLFHGLAAENLGDDALHLAAIALVD